jgi:CheY-like chemotaxis protein
MLLALYHRIMSIMFSALVIEDQDKTRTALCNTLNRLGCQVTTTTNVEDGITLLSTHTYDAVFTALCLRGKGGRTIARWIKIKSPETKVFILTSWKGDLEVDLLNADGIHDVIRLPLNFSEIRDKLLEHLG